MAPNLADVKAYVAARIADPRGARLIRRVQSQKLTYLNLAALHDLQAAVRDAEDTSRPGALVECGCALGGSAIVLAAARRGNDRPVWVYDVFGMIPPPSDRDGEDVKDRYSTIVGGEAKGLDGETYYGYKQDLYDEVAASFRRFGLPVETSNIHLIKGLFEDTLRPEGAVALAHLDGDWYDSVMVCLERLWPLLSDSGVIIIDDYYAWSGCRRAVDDFTAMRSDCERQEKARLHLVKAHQ
jgi:predicted O-methyltransferase YrrM